MLNIKHEQAVLIHCRLETGTMINMWQVGLSALETGIVLDGRLKNVPQNVVDFWSALFSHTSQVKKKGTQSQEHLEAFMLVSTDKTPLCSSTTKSHQVWFSSTFISVSVFMFNCLFTDSLHADSSRFRLLFCITLVWWDLHFLVNIQGELKTLL